MYDDIAELYHLIYEDWDEAIARQAAGLLGVLQESLGTRAELDVLGVSCGIGTQALGLAAAGHSVTASDLSPQAVERARREAQRRDLCVRFSVADMRHCYDAHGSGYAVALTCDNSLPHLATEDDVRMTLSGLFDCLAPSGLVIVGMRDYAQVRARGEKEISHYGRRSDGQSRYTVFQTRDWSGDSYEVGMYFVREMTDEAPASVVSGKSRYYALGIERVMAIMREVGFNNITRNDDALYQPIITGAKDGGMS